MEVSTEQMKYKIEMKVVEERFESFKRFIRSIVKKENQFIIDFMNLQFNHFLLTVYAKSLNGIDKEQCIDEILLASETTKEDYSKDDLARAIRYMDYFIEICRVSK
jgi:hypothetical protein